MLNLIPDFTLSDTCLSLEEFRAALGISPWRFWQLEKDCSEPTPAIIRNQSTVKGPCSCIFQESWMAGRQGRTDFARAIHLAERVFLKWAKYAPCPTQFTIEKELRGDTLTGWNPRCIVELDNVGDGSKFVQFGTIVKTLAASDVVLTRDDAGAIRNFFTSDPVPVPDDTQPEDVCAFFRLVDGGDPPEPHAQIRPIRVDIDSGGGPGNWLATITAQAYLFVRPELYENDFCLCAGDLDNYVEMIDVYVSSIDECDQGAFIYDNGNCGDTPCDTTETQACFITKRDKRWAQPQPVNCSIDPDTGEVVRTKYCLTQRPDRVRINYVAGCSRGRFGTVDKFCANVVLSLAVALMACDVDMCDCETCTGTRKSSDGGSMFRWLREIPKVVIDEGEQGVAGNRYVFGFAKSAMDWLRGYEPRRGLLMAQAEIRQNTGVDII